ncbi:LysR substrate-binding domain-containing protein [Variovorax sp. GB1R11]|uniref:LysR family transcriptional regulator n=1 Tax=Variovorax sp. GB1R11 TaxID=3443741 RepID=UPI003F4454AE
MFTRAGRVMNLRRLQYFVDFATRDSARRAVLDWETVKSHIVALERELGFDLFDRNLRGVKTLTPAGGYYLREAQRIVDAHRHALESAREWDTGVAGRLRLGLCEEAATSRLAATVAAFTTSHGNVALEVKEGSSADLAGAVRARTIDMALTLPDIEEAGLALCPLWQDPWLVALPPGHRLAALEKVGCEDLANESLVLADPLMPLHGHESIRNQFMAAGITPKVGGLAVNRSTMLMLTAVGVGLTFVPRSMVSARLHRLPSMQLIFKPFVGPPMQIIGLVSSHDASRLAVQFLDAAVAAFAKAAESA